MGGKVKDKLFEKPLKCGGGGATSVSRNLGVANHCKWTGKWWSRLKDRTESEGQALREDGKWWSSFQK